MNCNLIQAISNSGDLFEATRRLLSNLFLACVPVKGNDKHEMN